ncbi:hypothetical protein [Paenibacillus odorifer]|uniref:Lipoprotein n=1 Tax=Paenibacillus odorifer TaxID=189426 RepID=A0A1R0Y6S9_9BACL|nr:hypothetical protein [Paenibacillus odorifer]OMD43025.1 hypothetical protein BSK52_05865 [Paenibacillus odorifer]
MKRNIEISKILVSIITFIMVLGISGCGNGNKTETSMQREHKNLYDSIESERWMSANRYLDEENLRDDTNFSVISSYVELRTEFDVGIINGEDNYSSLKPKIDSIKNEILDYDGEFKEQISEFINGFDQEYVIFHHADTSSPEKENDSLPYIGMSEEKLLQTLWGKPKEINKTETKDGISEQWVYESNRYVYLDNGVVTAIQE